MQSMMEHAEIHGSDSNHVTLDEPPRDTQRDQTSDKSGKDQYSFYECPTAACSITSVGAQHDTEAVFGADRFKSFSLDGSENETGRIDEPGKGSNDSIDSNPLSSLSGEGGSVSYSQLQRATGGYVGVSDGMLVQGSAVLSEKPRHLIPNSAILGSTLPESNVRSVIMTPVSASMRMSTGETSAGRTIAQSVPQSPSSYRQDSPMSASTSVNVASPAVKDYSRAVDCGNTSETSFVHEGYDTIQVPRYRPVEVVERVVEVPVVHHVDTYVPKKEVQEIESFVRKPYTKYVDKFVEVPEIHYNDKIVEVPEYHEVTKTVQKVEIQERIKYVPKVEVRVVPKYVEVPVVKVVDRYEEYEEVEEVVRHVEKTEIVEVPRDVVKHVVKPVKKIIEQERIVPVVEHRDVPVEKIKFVPKVETVELTREIPKIIDVPVPYNVFKVEYVDQPYTVPEYRDVHVAVPVRKMVTPIYHYRGEPEVIDVPVHKPYFVIHDHISFKPASQPVAENIKVVGTRPIDLSTLSDSERQDVQARMQMAGRERGLDMWDTRIGLNNHIGAHESYFGPSRGAGDYQNAASPSDIPVSPRALQGGGVPETVNFQEPTFRACPSNNNQLNKPVEAIIYRNSSPSHYSPVSDAYPHSNTTTPRIVI